MTCTYYPSITPLLHSGGGFKRNVVDQTELATCYGGGAGMLIGVIKGGIALF